MGSRQSPVRGREKPPVRSKEHHDKPMKHRLAKCENCTRTNCPICDGGLAMCEVCKGFEGSLTTECCGRKLTPQEEHEIYTEGMLNFRDGKWLRESNTKHQLQ